MNRNINICYIDDRLDPLLSQYLDGFCEDYNREEGSDYSLEFSEYKFRNVDNYKTLMSNNKVNKANIIIIDSYLFENENSNLSKFTGEQFKIILKQILPFIKTIVISQNPINTNSVSISKYKSSGFYDTGSEGEYKKYYEENLAEVLKTNIISTIEEKEVINQISADSEVDSILVDTIQTTISGIVDKALFEKEDLDELIKLFNEVKTNYGH